MNVKGLPRLIWIAACLFPLLSMAQDGEKGKEVTDFIRVVRDAGSVRLQTGVTRYVKGDVSVDLIGAIHIADAGYFKRLNNEFTHYDSLLFEMVGGEGLQKHLKNKEDDSQRAKVKVKDPLLRVLGGAYQMVSQFLNLQNQMAEIDYTAKNFVHADLSLAEFERLQQKKEESLLGFALENAKQARKQAKLNREKEGADSKKKHREPDSRKLLVGLLRGDANMVKREIVQTMGQADDQVAAFAGESVIISDRNAKCLKVLDRQIKAGDQKIGIFYGAAHLNDMEKRLLKAGYKKVSHRWLTAWDIPDEG